MENIAIIRKIDDLGRVCIPKAFRKLLNINLDDSIGIGVVGNQVILQKYTHGCSHCGLIGIVAELGDIKLCSGCKDKLIRGA